MEIHITQETTYVCSSFGLSRVKVMKILRVLENKRKTDTGKGGTGERMVQLKSGPCRS